MRYALKIAYDGTAYAGWQRQKNALSVQECLETSIMEALGADVRVTASGRTDAGVHAAGQVCHFDSEKITVLFRYADYDITGIFLNNASDAGIWLYSQSVLFEKGCLAGMDPLTNAASREFHSFYDVLRGEPAHHSYDELFAPVFIMNAIERSMNNGNEEAVLYGGQA